MFTPAVARMDTCKPCGLGGFIGLGGVVAARRECTLRPSARWAGPEVRLLFNCLYDRRCTQDRTYTSERGRTDVYGQRLDEVGDVPHDYTSLTQ